MKFHPSHLGHHQIAEDYVEHLSVADSLQSFFGSGQRDHLVLGRKRAPHRLRDHRLVVHHENSAASVGGGGARDGRPFFFAKLCGRGQERDSERGAFADLTLDLYQTAEARYDSMAN